MLLFGVCFVLYFIKLSAGKGFFLMYCYVSISSAAEFKHQRHGYTKTTLFGGLLLHRLFDLPTISILRINLQIVSNQV